MEGKKRQRAPNFTSTESLLLCNLLENYKHTIENKKTDGVTVAEKQKCWKMLTEEYNARTPYVARTSENLFAAYKNLKTKAKKQHSSEKMAISNLDANTVPSTSRETEQTLIESMELHGADWDKVAADVHLPTSECEAMFDNMTKKAKISDSQYKKMISSTGGGPPPSPPNDPVLEKVKVLIGPGLEGMFTIYDSDADFMKQQQELLPDDKKIDPVDAPTVFINELATPTPKLGKRIHTLKKRIDAALDPSDAVTETASQRKPKKQKVSDSFLQLSKSKQELVDIQIQIAQEQLSHQKRIQEMEIKQMMAKMEFEKEKKNSEMNYLKEKWELELSSLRSKLNTNTNFSSK